MATVSDILLDGLGRVRETVHGLLDDVPEASLTEPPAPGTNTISWLVWHLTRVLDTHVADAFDVDVVWTTGGWYERFDLPFPASAHGYGMSYDDVLRVQASAENLRGYFDASCAMAEEQLRTANARRAAGPEELAIRERLISQARGQLRVASRSK